MSFDSLVGNESSKEWLRRAAKTGRMPGTLIFAGPDGVGKKSFALALAKSLNCPNCDENFNSCDNCPVCRRIGKGEFTDVQLIVPDGQFIKIEQARAVVAEIHFRPFEGRYRVYIFDNAERLREQAANALLKTLEEPPDTALLVLVTSSPEALLPTIRSRATRLNFAPLPLDQMERYLAANYPRPAIEQQLLTRISQGSLGTALSIDLSEYFEQRKECLELLELLLKRPHRGRILKAAEYFGRKERAEFDSRLSILLALLRDLICVKLTLPEQVINFDISARLTELLNGVDDTRLTLFSDQLQRLARELSRNLNRQLALEAIFLKL